MICRVFSCFSILKIKRFYLTDPAAGRVVVPTDLTEIDRKKTYPKTTDAVEAGKIAVFERPINIGSLKAGKVIKMDIVNPIPPKIPAPNRCFQCTEPSLDAQPSRALNQEKRKIPAGFPRARPANIPTLNIALRNKLLFSLH